MMQLILRLEVLTIDMPFIAYQAIQDWTFGEESPERPYIEIMVLGIPLRHYCAIIESWRHAVNVSIDEMARRLSFCYVDSFEGFQWLDINLSGLWPRDDTRCSHNTWPVVQDKATGVTAYHGSKRPQHVVYCRRFEKADNPRQGKQGLYHTSDPRYAMHFAKPVHFGGELRWRAMFELQVP